MNKSSDSRDLLIQKIGEQSRELSSRTVLFHHWISELLGLNTIDHKCLDIIVSSEAHITGVQLANKTGLSSGAITGVIDRLEKAGYVVRERDQKDRRLVYIKPVMKKIETDVIPIFLNLQQIMYKIYSEYSTKELEVILDATTKLNHIMDERTSYVMENISLNKSKKI